MENLKYKRLLFIEDDKTYARMMMTFFNMFVMEVLLANDIDEAKRLYKEKDPDFIISDISLNGENGLDFIEYIRKINFDIPVVMMTSLKTQEILLHSVKLNLTSYLIKPCEYPDILKMFQNVSKKFNSSVRQIFELKNNYYYDNKKKILLKNGEKIQLNKKEILFMELLIKYKDGIITKEMIEYSLWEETLSNEKTLSNFISNIRKRFGKDFIYTIPNVGYRF